MKLYDELFVGVKIDEYGNSYFSQAAKIITDQAPTSEAKSFTRKQLVIKEAQDLGLTEENLMRAIQSIRNKSSMEKNAILRAKARQFQVDQKNFQSLVFRYESERIKEISSGPNYHYHRTSIDSLASILEMGAFLSRSELKRRKPELALPGWSARDEVMMTRDKYDQTGKLVKPGLGQVTGASGRGITFALKESIMDLPGYDAVDMFPCLPEIPIRSSTEAILVDSEGEITEVQKILQRFGYEDIPVLTIQKWQADHYKVN